MRETADWSESRHDAGGRWQAPSGTLPEAAKRSFDWRAVAAIGRSCWIAGSPGSQVLHTQDGGAELVHAPDGSFRAAGRIALRRRAVRLGGRFTGNDSRPPKMEAEPGSGVMASPRARRLRCSAADARSVPLELVARYCAADGYLGVVAAIARRDLAPDAAEDLDLASRLHDATVSTGGVRAETAWRFPVAQSELQLETRQMVDDWNRFNNADSLELLREYMVRQIRCWRPEVIVTSTDGGQGDPLSGLVNRAAMQAVDDATDETRFAHQLRDAGLATWRVKKVYEVTHGEGGAATRLPNAQWNSQPRANHLRLRRSGPGTCLARAGTDIPGNGRSDLAGSDRR